MYYVFFIKADESIKIAEFAELNEAAMYVDAMIRKAKSFGASLYIKYEED